MNGAALYQRRRPSLTPHAWPCVVPPGGKQETAPAALIDPECEDDLPSRRQACITDGQSPTSGEAQAVVLDFSRRRWIAGSCVGVLHEEVVEVRPSSLPCCSRSVTMIASFSLLSVSMRTLPLSTAYPSGQVSAPSARS